jgi:citrate lyase beta subunit
MPESILARTQPVHVVYGGAHLFKASTCDKLRDLARRAGAENDLQAMLGLPGDVAALVNAKLAQEPLEDYRIDFEDGFGVRPDEEEDAAAVNAAREIKHAALPRQCGIRVKAGARGFRTLHLFLDNIGGSLPRNFVVTLPKVSSVDQITVFAAAVPFGVGIELMIETPEAVRNVREFVDACDGRCVGAHLGAYDYLASLGIAQQDLSHPACDFARTQMLLQLAGTGVWLSDGATNVLPLKGSNIQAAWKLHYGNTRRALYNGFYQGWDLHPAQIPARYAAVFSFFHEGMEIASARLRNFVAAAAQATHVGGLFDDAATGQGLLNYFLRARACGAIAGGSDLPIDELAKLLGRE